MKLSRALVTAMGALTLATPLFAGPILPTPTASPSPGSPTPTMTATPTPVLTCQDFWPHTCIFTIGKGQSPANNRKVGQRVCGHIVEPDSLNDTAHRIPVCRGTMVIAYVEPATATLTATSANILCGANSCLVRSIQETAKYVARSADGKDTDRMVFTIAK